MGFKWALILLMLALCVVNIMYVAAQVVLKHIPFTGNAML